MHDVFFGDIMMLQYCDDHKAHTVTTVHLIYSDLHPDCFVLVININNDNHKNVAKAQNGI